MAKRLLVLVASPERLRRGRALQSKLLGLVSTARANFFTVRSPLEISLCFKWEFLSSEYDGFPSKPEELDDICPLPQKIVIRWTLEEIDRCNDAIDKGFIKIIAYSRSPMWTRLELYKSLRSRVFDFIESSIGRRLIPRARNLSPISNDEDKNFYRWVFNESHSQFLSTPFSLWHQEKYFELNNALNSGALKIMSTGGNISSNKGGGRRPPPIKVSSKTNSTRSTKLHRNKNERPRPPTQMSQLDEDDMPHPHSIAKEKNRHSTDGLLVKSPCRDVFYWNTDSPNSSLINESSHTPILQAPSSGSIQQNNKSADVGPGDWGRDMNNMDLLRLCNQAWLSLESRHKTDGTEHGSTRATLNMGLSYAIQLKDQIQRKNILEHENDNLKLKILQLEHNEAELQQQLSNTRENTESEISNARLHGEKIAEKNVESLWNSAKERGRVIGVWAMKSKYNMEGHQSTFTNQPRLGLSPRSSAIQNTGTRGRHVLSNIPKQIPLMCADETRSHLPKENTPYLPLESDPTLPVDALVDLSVGLLPTMADLEAQNFHHQIPVTNASVQLPSTTHAFHKSFLNEVFGPINRTLNNIPPSHIPNSVEWTRFFTIHLDTQPYIFPLPYPTQTFGQIVHFISQHTAEVPRATQGTTYPALLRLSQDIEQYSYVGHFVVSNVITTTDFDSVLKNMPDNNEHTKHAKHKLLKERDRALGSGATIARDMPVDFYTLQYVFFGEEQYKILVSAQERFDALKSADDTIDSLLGESVRNGWSAHSLLANKLSTGAGVIQKRLSYISEDGRLSQPESSNRNTVSTRPLSHKNFPSGPAAMVRRHPPVSGSGRLSESSNHNTTNTSISPTNKLHTEISSTRCTHPSSTKNESPTNANHPNLYTISRPNPLSKNPQNEPPSTKRKQPTGDENASPWEGSQQRKKKTGPGSVQIDRNREL